MIQTYHSEQEFQENRLQRIGSSDIGTLAGLNVSYGENAFTLYCQWKGKLPRFEGNEKTYWGHMQEKLVLMRYIEGLHGKEFAEFFYKELINDSNEVITADKISYKLKTFAIHPEYNFCIAHADLINTEIEHIQEAKTGSYFANVRKDNPDKGYSDDNFTSDGVPLSVYLQTQWQLFCYNYKTAGVSALIDTSDYREYGHWKSDIKTQEKCLALADRFMWHIRNDVPPNPETWQNYQIAFPDNKDESFVIDLNYDLKNGITIKDMLEEYYRLHERNKKDKEKLDEIKTAFGLLMKDNKYLQSIEGVVIAQNSLTEFIEPKSMKEIEKHPDVVNLLKAKDLLKEVKFKKMTIKKREQVLGE